MRRSDREVTDPAKIREIVQSCVCCRLAFCDGERPYIVPLSFGYSESDGKYTLFFHGAKEGRKIDLIRSTGFAGFEMDCGYQLHEAPLPCKHSAAFCSIIGEGPVSMIEDAAEKTAALQAVMAHTTGKSDWTFEDTMLNSVCVWKLEVQELSCKEHL